MTRESWATDEVRIAQLGRPRQVSGSSLSGRTGTREGKLTPRWAGDTWRVGHQHPAGGWYNVQSGGVPPGVIVEHKPNAVHEPVCKDKD